jgi:hypothetical protein
MGLVVGGATEENAEGECEQESKHAVHDYKTGERVVD